MKAIHKRLSEGNKIPVVLVYKDTKTPQMELPHHLHDWHEIIYVYSGKGTLLVNHTFYEMNEGDLFLIPGNTVHRAFPDEYNPVTSSALFFSPALIQPLELGEQGSILRCLENARRNKQYKLETPQSERASITSFVASIHEELGKMMAYYQTAVQIRVCDLLLTLNRISLPGTSAKGDSMLEPLWMRETLSYMDTNIGDPNMTLSALSKRAAITPSHFSRVFKQLTGMNVTEYVVVKRVMLAKELLVRTDDSIKTICEKCGMESESYFYHKFKLITGMTPKAYKTLHRI
ncbi:AraC family transcriptional regulator [Paenibacillus sp. sptzw28]|uniref:AraC family transcriptional regulator n=1 Tax=Paenibacillus sp. sptzw28 TaxID=715179 RepID=UPI001C6EB523|nr:AraC family transcriptional regulator [Paenibacillus sp. sptzw28]QYR23075.1 AraC family transcriptional regulator [Paenibacillus sp. sptzw28]